ncbi:MAG: hypothetical protein EPN36_16820 [Rhodanobacteraceae bacterium]|nr:MAG: hypothetical protein EPN36_16820 [Rhodanobacteraceae bacterium]
MATSAAGVAAAGALACAACCVLPFALPAAVLAIAGGALAWFAGIREEAIVAAIALVVTGWAWVVWRSLRTSKRPAAATMLVMFAASAMLALAYSWPAIEPVALTLLTPR